MTAGNTCPNYRATHSAQECWPMTTWPADWRGWVEWDRREKWKHFFVNESPCGNSMGFCQSHYIARQTLYLGSANSNRSEMVQAAPGGDSAGSRSHESYTMTSFSCRNRVFP